MNMGFRVQVDGSLAVTMGGTEDMRDKGGQWEEYIFFQDRSEEGFNKNTEVDCNRLWRFQCRKGQANRYTESK